MACKSMKQIKERATNVYPLQESSYHNLEVITHNALKSYKTSKKNSVQYSILTD